MFTLGEIMNEEMMEIQFKQNLAKKDLEETASD